MHYSYPTNKTIKVIVGFEKQQRIASEILSFKADYLCCFHHFPRPRQTYSWIEPMTSMNTMVTWHVLSDIYSSSERVALGNSGLRPFIHLSVRWVLWILIFTGSVNQMVSNPL